jgi:tetratricopeptide (TPR) repeat protein
MDRELNLSETVFSESKESPRFGKLRVSLIFLIFALILGLIGWKITPIFLNHISQRFDQRGDTLLLSQDYPSAVMEYQKALKYNPQDSYAKQQLVLAQSLPTDPLAGESFFTKNGDSEMVTKIQAATKAYSDPKEALQVGANLYANQDYAFAQYPLALAVKLDPGFSQAWNYLGLDYQELAKLNPLFAKKAQAAFATRDNLTVQYIKP